MKNAKGFVVGFLSAAFLGASLGAGALSSYDSAIENAANEGQVLMVLGGSPKTESQKTRYEKCRQRFDYWLSIAEKNFQE